MSVRVCGWHAEDSELSSRSLVTALDEMVNSETDPEQPRNNCLAMHHPERRARGVLKAVVPCSTNPHALRICKIWISWVPWHTGRRLKLTLFLIPSLPASS